MSSVPPPAPNNPTPPNPNPPAADDPILKEISKQAMASLIVGILCMTICWSFAIILGPFAIFRGMRATKLIKQHNVGQNYSTFAMIGAVLGVISMILSVILIAFIIITLPR